jgi:hypothetical protein
VTAYIYGCGGLVDTGAPIEVEPADLARPPFHAQHIYRCLGCGREVQALDGWPIVGEMHHGERVS